jgi:hypothetical protein
MIQLFKVEQYPGNPPTFGVALFEVRADSWYCGSLLPQRIRDDYDFGNDRSSANLRRMLANANEWRYIVKDDNGEVLGCTDSCFDALEFAGALSAKLGKIHVHDRDERWACFYSFETYVPQSYVAPSVAP